MFSAGYDRPNFFEFFIADDLFYFSQSIFTCDDNDSADAAARRSNAWMVWAMTGLPAIVANNLSKPMRRLSPAATMMAVSMTATLKR